MTRTNKPYDSKKLITEEEIQEARDNLEDDCEPMKIIERMWQEIQDLREVLRKQVY